MWESITPVGQSCGLSTASTCYQAVFSHPASAIQRTLELFNPLLYFRHLTLSTSQADYQIYLHDEAQAQMLMDCVRRDLDEGPRSAENA